MKTIELIKQIIIDLNSKELRDYPNCAEVYIYASKENIDKIQKNNIEKHRYNQEYIIQRYMNECENLRNHVYDLQEDIIRYK